MAEINDQDVTAEDDDPRVARVMRRMRLFVAISSAVMAIGFFTVISVIVWRLVKAEPEIAGAGDGNLREWSVPAGSRILATTADGGRLFVMVEARGGARFVHVLDAASLRPVGRISEVAAP